jgi:hypothetical protein
MIRTQPGLLCKLRERQGRLAVLDGLASLDNQFIASLLLRQYIGPAAFAGAVSRCGGEPARIEEFHVLPFRGA